MEAPAKQLTLVSEGITCTGCAADLEGLLREVPGIREASVSYAAGTIRVRYDPEAIDPRGVLLAVRRLGLGATIAEGG